MNPGLILIASALFTWGIGEGMFFYFQPIYLEQLGANPILIGTILGGFGLAMTIVHIPSGYLADRIGRLPMLRAAWISGLAAAWIMAIGKSLPVFVTGMILYGLTAFVAAPLSSYITAARGTWSVGRVLTLISATFNLGMMIGPISGGLLADRFGLQSVYFAAAAFFVISTLIVFFLRPQPRDEIDPDSPPVKLLTNSRYISFLALSFFVMFAMYLPQPLTPNFLQAEKGLLLSRIGLLGTFGALGNALLSFGLGSLLSARQGFVVGQILAAVFSLLIWRGSGLPAFALAFFLLGGYRAARSLAIAQVRSLVHSSQMGIAYGVTETVNAMPIILAPPLAGYLYTQDPAVVYPVSLGMITLMIILSVAFSSVGRLVTSSPNPSPVASSSDTLNTHFTD